MLVIDATGKLDPAKVLAIRLHDLGHAVRAEDIRSLLLFIAADEDAERLWNTWLACVRGRVG